MAKTPYQKIYEHRRQWIEVRIRLLSSLFSLEFLSYAIMSNLLHIVLKALPDEATQLSDREVLQRWLSIYKELAIAQRYLKGDKLSKAEEDSLQPFIDERAFSAT